eukprot:TRINITY_DN1565_c0_g1_i5.p2 TRINITY_DN1565_c0_g1~~TRINITY_DN1565_c0_g1_i5.p2  ORF type:complete len:232 (+),score=127.52 TRINITY_DN1565_c0_g1_i5:134-829(+)
MAAAADLSARGLQASDAALANVDFDKYFKAASDESVERTKAALEAKGHKVSVCETAAEALELLKATIPVGSSISNGHSTTLIEIGWDNHIKHTEDYKNFKGEAVAKMRAGDMAGYAASINAGYSADYFLASVAAITEEGEFLTADLTGTRWGGFVAARTAIVVAGTNKIVPNFAAAEERLYNFQLPLESARSRIVYGVPGSQASNVFAVKGGNPFAPGHYHVVLVKGVYGF